MRRKDFTVKIEQYTRNKFGKREYLSDVKTKELREAFYKFMETNVEIPRMQVGSRMTFETLISETCMSLAQYLRNERKDWNSQISL